MVAEHYECSIVLFSNFLNAEHLNYFALLEITTATLIFVHNYWHDFTGFVLELDF